jgi:hypothetical protein
MSNPFASFPEGDLRYILTFNREMISAQQKRCRQIEQELARRASRDDRQLQMFPETEKTP